MTGPYLLSLDNKVLLNKYYKKRKYLLRNFTIIICIFVPRFNVSTCCRRKLSVLWLQSSNIFTMDLGLAIKSLRKDLGLSRTETAKRSNISVTALYNIENGLSFPAKETIDRLAFALGVPVAYILFFSITPADLPEAKRETFHYFWEPMRTFLLEK